MYGTIPRLRLIKNGTRAKVIIVPRLIKNGTKANYGTKANKKSYDA
jgi:hypothetical protein